MSERAVAIGVDCGSTWCKGAVVARDGVRALHVIPTGWDVRQTGADIVRLLRGEAGADKAPVVATGYGRSQIEAAGRAVTEISCHAKGASFLLPGVQGIIDIGGQDCKAIGVRDSKVLSFQMNDKCAAGSGRFLEMVLTRLDISFEALDTILAAGKLIRLNSTCVVFAESEIIGLLAKGVTREEIVGGVVQSMADKIVSLAARVEMASPVVLTGGLSGSGGLCAALSSVMRLPVRSVEHGLYAGAIGAALYGLEG